MSSGKFIQKLKKYKVLISFFVLMLLLINSIFFVLYFKGNLRYNVMRLTAEANNIYTDYMLYRVIEQRRFQEGVDLLHSQLKYVQRISSGNNLVVEKLIENINYSFNKTISTGDRDLFEPLLKKLVEFYPDVYSFRIHYARSLENNPKKEIYTHLDQAIKLVGSDSRAYRIALEYAYKNGDKLKLKEYCDSYFSNQEGALKYNEIPWSFPGIGLRSMMLELQDDDKKIYVKNNGIDLYLSKKYEFLLPKNINLNKPIRLHIATMKGISFDIVGLELYSKGEKVFSGDRKSITFFTENSFVNNNGSIILLAENKPEIIELHINSIDKDLFVDKVSIIISIQKLSTASLNICQ